MSASSNRKARRQRARHIARQRDEPVDVARFHRDQDASRASLRAATVRWAGLSVSDQCEALDVTQVEATTWHGTRVLVTVSMTMRPITPVQPNPGAHQ